MSPPKAHHNQGQSSATIATVSTAAAAAAAATTKKRPSIFRHVVNKLKRAFRYRPKTGKRSSQHPTRCRKTNTETQVPVATKGTSPTRSRTRRRRTSHLEQPLPGDNWEWASQRSIHSSSPSSTGTGVSPKTSIRGNRSKHNQPFDTPHHSESESDLDSPKKKRRGAISEGRPFPKETSPVVPTKKSQFGEARPKIAPPTKLKSNSFVQDQNNQRIHKRTESESTLMWINQAREEARQEFEADMQKWDSPHIPDRSYHYLKEDYHSSGAKSIAKAQRVAPRGSENNILRMDSSWTKVVRARPSPQKRRGSAQSARHFNLTAAPHTAVTNGSLFRRVSEPAGTPRDRIPLAKGREVSTSISSSSRFEFEEGRVRGGEMQA